MKTVNKITIGIVAILGLGATAATVYAQPGPMGMMGYGMMGGGGPGMMGGRVLASNQAFQQLMSPEERTALMEKMSKATTIEERQKMATANFAEMEKRAKEKGIALPAQRGPQSGRGQNCG